MQAIGFKVSIFSILIILAFNLPAAQLSSRHNINKLWQEYANESKKSFAKQRFPFQQCFEQSAKEHDLPVAMLLAVARGESNFDPRAKSKANAIGVMQIQWPATAHDLGFKSKAELRDPCKNIDGGARYLRKMVNRYEGDYHHALAAYNYGPGRITLGKKVPDGAKWYSSYIYDHLEFVRSRAGATDDTNFAEARKRVLLTFNRPYEARGYVGTLRDLAPGLVFEWFKEFDENKPDSPIFQAVLIYTSESDLVKSEQRLRSLGLIR